MSLLEGVSRELAKQVNRGAFIGFIGPVTANKQADEASVKTKQFQDNGFVFAENSQLVVVGQDKLKTVTALTNMKNAAQMVCQANPALYNSLKNDKILFVITPDLEEGIRTISRELNVDISIPENAKQDAFTISYGDNQLGRNHIVLFNSEKLADGIKYDGKPITGRVYSIALLNHELNVANLQKSQIPKREAPQDYASQERAAYGASVPSLRKISKAPFDFGLGFGEASQLSWLVKREEKRAASWNK